MKMAVAHDGGCAVVRLAGRLDGESAESLVTSTRRATVGWGTGRYLLSDDRGGAGAGESHFHRGLCWAAPVTRVVGAA
jgi:hypothetical protein